MGKRAGTDRSFTLGSTSSATEGPSTTVRHSSDMHENVHWPSSLIFEVTYSCQNGLQNMWLHLIWKTAGDASSQQIGQKKSDGGVEDASSLARLVGRGLMSMESLAGTGSPASCSTPSADSRNLSMRRSLFQLKWRSRIDTMGV